ncbi:MAG: hypothetical protein EHM84_09495 [Lysobacterales bacterium]|nr:MAG: hypothetical protein EHM84_09495 [Xanthomonadales bacterium]
MLTVHELAKGPTSSQRSHPWSRDAACLPCPADRSCLAMDDTHLDGALVAGVQRLQRRHGLDIDGVLGTRTFAALTTPLDQRVRQIELTLERWRWTSSLERTDIVVNIPQSALRVSLEPSDTL